MLTSLEEAARVLCLSRQPFSGHGTGPSRCAHVLTICVLGSHSIYLTKREKAIQNGDSTISKRENTPPPGIDGFSVELRKERQVRVPQGRHQEVMSLTYHLRSPSLSHSFELDFLLEWFKIILCALVPTKYRTACVSKN